MNQRFTYRNPKILAHANGQACQNCGCQDGTTVAAHSNLKEHGRGSSFKSHDHFTAFLCFECHTWLDAVGKRMDPTGRYNSSATEKREMFLSAMFKTQIILLRDGVLK